MVFGAFPNHPRGDRVCRDAFRRLCCSFEEYVVADFGDAELFAYGGDFGRGVVWVALFEVE